MNVENEEIPMYILQNAELLQAEALQLGKWEVTLCCGPSSSS